MRLPLVLILAGLAHIPVWAQITVQPGTAQSLTAYCFDMNTGQVIPNCGLQLFNGYYMYTGGHNHESGRPQSGQWKAWGTITPTSGWYPGYSGLTVNFSAPQLGQWEWIDACAAHCTTSNVLVAFSDIYAYFPNNHAVLIGTTSTHPANHFGTSQTNSAVNAILQTYWNEFSACAQYQPVGVNDMALHHGGLFDYQATWQPPHHTHHRGRAVDFRCKPNLANSVIHHPYSISRFLQICRDNGLPYAIHEAPGTSNEHIHCATSHSGN